jgi:hypothetical protein
LPYSAKTGDVRFGLKSRLPAMSVFWRKADVRRCASACAPVPKRAPEGNAGYHYYDDFSS